MSNAETSLNPLGFVLTHIGFRDGPSSLGFVAGIFDLREHVKFVLREENQRRERGISVAVSKAVPELVYSLVWNQMKERFHHEHPRLVSMGTLRISSSGVAPVTPIIWSGLISGSSMQTDSQTEDFFERMTLLAVQVCRASIDNPKRYFISVGNSFRPIVLLI